MVGMTATAYTQEPDLELVGWVAEIDEQSALDAALALAMADVRAAEVLNELRETTVEWGEDTRCTVCLCPLPAGATAYRDSDSVLCVDDAEFELEAAGRTV